MSSSSPRASGPSRSIRFATAFLSFVLSIGAAERVAFAGDKDKQDKAGDKAGKSGKDDPKPAVEQHYDAEVLVLHATNGDKGIDPRIGKMPQLGQPPFSSYKSYELLKKVKLPLKKEDPNNKEDPKPYELPNGRFLKTKLLEVLPEDTVKISASINQPGGKTFLPLLEVKAKLHQSFIVAGQSYKDGILVLVIRVLSGQDSRTKTK